MFEIKEPGRWHFGLHLICCDLELDVALPVEILLGLYGLFLFGKWLVSQSLSILLAGLSLQIDVLLCMDLIDIVIDFSLNLPRFM